ncbi:MAG: hypothetical protein ACRDZQ_06920, partial [Acidimicrobiales bacterium]
LSRLEAMGLVREAGPGTLQVRRALAPVTQAQLARLAPSARRAHDLLVDRRDRESGAANNKDRAEVASARCREATRDLVRGGSFER